MGKSNRQKAMSSMQVPSAIGMPPKQNYASIRVKVERKLVDGNETTVGCIESNNDYPETAAGSRMPLEKEYSTAEELKKAVDSAIDGLYKKV